MRAPSDIMIEGNFAEGDRKNSLLFCNRDLSSAELFLYKRNPEDGRTWKSLDF